MQIQLLINASGCKKQWHWQYIQSSAHTPGRTVKAHENSQSKISESGTSNEVPRSSTPSTATFALPGH